MANVFGFLTAFYLHGIFSIFGLSALILGSPRAFFVMKTLGAFYLVYLGLKTLWGAFKHQRSCKELLIKTVLPRKKLLSSYSEGLLTNLFNPKVSVFYLAAFPQFVDFASGLTLARIGRAFGLVTIHALINFVWFTGMVFVISLIVSWARSSLFEHFIEGITGAVLLWFGYKLVTVRPNS